MISSRYNSLGFPAAYGLALGSTGVAALARWMLPWALTPAPYLGFYPAVVVSAALGGVGRAAEIFGLDRSTLRARMRKLGIQKP
jgi:hypothetical protein